MLPIFMQKTFTYKNEEISYSAQGKGALVILLHGFLENKSIWNHTTRFLSKNFMVVAIDLPGHGDTPCLGYVHSMDLMADVVNELIKHLNKRKCHIIGHSMGGYVALAFAEKYADKMYSLSMVCSNARADSKEKKKDRTKAIQLVKTRKALFVEAAIPSLFYTEIQTHTRAINRIKKMAHETSIQGTIAALSGMRDRYEREIVLKFAPYPVLMIAGEQDAIIPIQWLKEQSKLPDNCTLEVLENTGHMPFLEDRLVFETLLIRFLKGV
jgi:pimeloyl-ACP methyl ester carboxylesterase